MLTVVLCAIFAYIQMKWLEDRRERKQQKAVTFWVQVKKQ